MKSVDLIISGEWIIVMIVTILQVWVWVVVIRAIVQVFKRKENYKYFKNNVVTINNSLTKSNNSKYQRNYNDVSKEKLDAFNVSDINDLKDYFYEIFVKFEKAYNNLDYNAMKMISTKQLFQNYYTGMNLNIKVGQKKIIDNIERKKVVIYELDSTIAKQTASIMVEISYITYTIDKKGFIISGNRDIPVTERFEVEFRKEFEREIISNCPNCGAVIEGDKCTFCKTTLGNNDFKISSIKRIIDKINK